MKAVIYCFAMGLSVLASVGCNSADTQTAVEASVPVNKIPLIADKEWILRGMTIQAEDYPLSGRMPTLRFGQDGQVGGFASVNRYFGSVKMDGRGRLGWSEGFGATRMAGPPEAMRQESAFLQALVKTEFMSFDGGTLTVFAEDRKTVLTFSESAD